MKVYTVGLVLPPERFTGIWEMTDIQKEIMAMLSEAWGVPLFRRDMIAGGGYEWGDEVSQFTRGLHELVKTGYVAEVTMRNTGDKECLLGYVDSSSVTIDPETKKRSIPCVMRSDPYRWGAK